MLSDVMSSNRMRQPQDWYHPNNVQLYDIGPNVSDRFSEASSPIEAVEASDLTAGQQNIKTTPAHQEMGSVSNSHHNLEKELQLIKMSQEPVPIIDIISSNGGTKSQGYKESQKMSSLSNVNRLRKSKQTFFSPQAVLREEMVHKTKKIIKKLLKSDTPINLSMKGVLLQGIFKKIHNFIKVVRVFTRSHTISADQHHLIRDLASHRYDKTQLRKQKIISWQKIKDFFWNILDFIVRLGFLNKLLFKNKIILLPTDQLNVYWMLFQFFFNFFALYYASIYIVFDFRNRLLEIQNNISTASGIYTTNIFILIFMTILDIVKGFNTAYYRKGETIIDRKEVAINYFKGRLIFDFLSLVSVVFSRTFFPNMDKLWMYRIQFLFLFKIHNIQYNISVFKSTFIMNEKYDNILSLLRLLSILCLASHFGAIMYHCQAQLQIYYQGSELTWLSQAGLIEESYWVRYINSYFCSAGTLVNAIIYNPKTVIETAFMTFALIGNCCVFGYVINELGNIMDNIERKSKNSKRELRLINSFMEIKNVNRELQTRIRNYLDYMHMEERQLNLEETKEVIVKLSGSLKTELTKEVNAQYIPQFHILNSIFSQKIQEKSLFIMQDHKYTPGEIIFSEDEIDDCGIYLILEGQIDIYHTNLKEEDYLVKRLKSGQCFGEISFFTGQSRSASAKSAEFTSLIKIEREEFIRIIKEHSSDDYEVFQSINHKIQQTSDYSKIYKKETNQGKCYTCGSTNHISKNCTLTHFSPLPVAVISTASRSFYQERFAFGRKEFKKWKSREHDNLWKMEDAIQKIEENYESRIEEINDNILDQSDYLDQSEHQNFDRPGFDRQNTKDHYMLLSNQDQNDTLGGVRGDQRNISINLPGNVLYDHKKETVYLPEYYKSDSKDIKDVRKPDGFMSTQTRDLQVQIDQFVRRGSKFAPAYQQSTLTQIQEIQSPTNQPQQSAQIQQGNMPLYLPQGHLNNSPPIINGLLLQNNSFQAQGQAYLTSPKNGTIYNSRRVKKQGTLSGTQGTQVNKRVQGRYDSQNPTDQFPRQNTNQGGATQIHPMDPQQMANTAKLKDSFINLVEQFGSTVSLHIDFMRNYKKYYPEWNISSIEKTHIGGKFLSMSMDQHRKSEKNQLTKKSIAQKRSLPTTKKHTQRPSILKTKVS